MNITTNRIDNLESALKIAMQNWKEWMIQDTGRPPSEGHSSTKDQWAFCEFVLETEQRMRAIRESIMAGSTDTTD